MTQKKTDLAKNMALKLDGQLKGASTPGRFGQAATGPLDKREQRRRDAAAGQVPFACKLPADLNRTLMARADAHEGGVNALVAELLEKALA